MIVICAYDTTNHLERKVVAVRITKAEIAAIGITGVLLALMVGFYLGRNSTESTVIHATPEPSQAVEELAVAAPTQASEQGNGAAEASQAEPLPDSSQDSGLLDLNRATQGDLEELPGIGAVLAERILAYRDRVGGFSTVEELKNVEGIGDKKLEAILNLIEVGNEYENSGS